MHDIGEKVQVRMEGDGATESREMAESKEGIIYSEFNFSGEENVEGSSEVSVSSASPVKVLPLRRMWPIFPIAHF